MLFSIRKTAMAALVGSLMIAKADTLRTWYLGFEAPKSGGNFLLCFPAAQMKERAFDFRKNFVESYYTPQANFPLFALMYRARIFPIDGNDGLTLGKRGDFSFRDPSTLVNVAPVSTTCQSDEICDTADFPILLGGKSSTVKVNFAREIDVKVASIANDNTLSFDFGNGLPFHVDGGTTGIPFIRPDMVLKNVSISDKGLDETLYSSGSDSSEQLTVIIHLDFAGVCQTFTATGGKK